MPKEIPDHDVGAFTTPDLSKWPALVVLAVSVEVTLLAWRFDLPGQVGREDANALLLVFGLVVSVLISGLVWLLSREHRRALQREREMSESLRKSLAERLDRQPPEVVDAVLNASIIGQEVDLDTLDLASAAGGERSLALLEAAVAARLLDEVPGRPGHFRFLNRIDRELALERVSRARRRLIEGRLARP